ncbi:Hypothetical_protein [Hexamita inflata]|uniref:Hypothetical_protein n=1 Tax=Hexamita inflata TaxID=28002 RepID=A0AA86NPM8_9EUKA|nr:Hypothetical protein HINF_LOCUS11802 [Hexamita inflata]
MSDLHRLRATWSNVNGRAPTTPSPNREQDQRPNFSAINYKLEDPENWPMLHGTKSFMSREQKGSVDVMIDWTRLSSRARNNKIQDIIIFASTAHQGHKLRFCIGLCYWTHTFVKYKQVKFYFSSYKMRSKQNFELNVLF